MATGTGGIIRTVLTAIGGIGVWTVTSYVFGVLIPPMTTFPGLVPGATALSDLNVNIMAWYAGVIIIIVLCAYSLLHEAFVSKGQ